MLDKLLILAINTISHSIKCFVDHYKIQLSAYLLHAQGTNDNAICPKRLFLVYVAEEGDDAVGIGPIFVGGVGLGEICFHIGEGLGVTAFHPQHNVALRLKR